MPVYSRCAHISPIKTRSTPNYCGQGQANRQAAEPVKEFWLFCHRPSPPHHEQLHHYVDRPEVKQTCDAGAGHLGVGIERVFLSGGRKRAIMKGCTIAVWGNEEARW